MNVPNEMKQILLVPLSIQGGGGPGGPPSYPYYPLLSVQVGVIIRTRWDLIIRIYK